MNNDLAMIMADCETPYAIVPPEMVGLEDANEETPNEVLYAKITEVNTILANQCIAVVPSLIENVEGLFLVKYNEPMSENDRVVIEMFVRPALDQGLLDLVGAAHLSKLLSVEECEA